MKEIFLSASVPEQERGNFYESADPFLIQFAVRELITVCLGRRRIVWGGHPSITPMVHAVCKDFGMEFAPPVLLYQSRFFENRFPDKYFETILSMRCEKICRAALLSFGGNALAPIETAVFIGGMEGTFHEFEIFRALHGPDANVLALGAQVEQRVS